MSCPLGEKKLVSYIVQRNEQKGSWPYRSARQERQACIFSKGCCIQGWPCQLFLRKRKENKKREKMSKKDRPNFFFGPVSFLFQHQTLHLTEWAHHTYTQAHRTCDTYQMHRSGISGTCLFALDEETSIFPLLLFFL